MQVPVYNLSGEVVKNIEVSDAVFGAPLNEALVHQVMVSQQANQRQGTSDTKTRGEVAGSSKKLYRQKHTGEARAGTRRSPLRRGGGIIFGPHQRDYRQAIPKKMRRLAIRSVLSAKLSDGELKVLEDIKFEIPKTKQIIQGLAALGIDSTVLIVTAEPEMNVIKSARNVPGVKTLPANTLSVLDMLSSKMLLMTETAVRQSERLWETKLVQRGDHASV
ncbi:MAG: 50S ribosomal protein L4 [Dehalococcoidales bacterium]|nr:50S ribosomal protein L4 [Dehalococcoidales bacterium]